MIDNFDMMGKLLIWKQIVLNGRNGCMAMLVIIEYGDEEMIWMQ